MAPVSFPWEVPPHAQIPQMRAELQPGALAGWNLYIALPLCCFPRQSSG